MLVKSYTCTWCTHCSSEDTSSWSELELELGLGFRLVWGFDLVLGLKSVLGYGLGLGLGLILGHYRSLRDCHTHCHMRSLSHELVQVIIPAHRYNISLLRSRRSGLNVMKTRQIGTGLWEDYLNLFTTMWKLKTTFGNTRLVGAHTHWYKKQPFRNR